MFVCKHSYISVNKCIQCETSRVIYIQGDGEEEEDDGDALMRNGRNILQSIRPSLLWKLLSSSSSAAHSPVLYKFHYKHKDYDTTAS